LVRCAADARRNLRAASAGAGSRRPTAGDQVPAAAATSGSVT